MSKFTWTQDKIDELTRLWGAGYTGSQIRLLLKAPTRNVVMGKIHRLGMQRRLPPKVRPAIELDFIEPEPDPEPVSPPATDTPPPPTPELTTVVEAFSRLPAKGCRWPYGHPSTAKFAFCGAEKDTLGPYCEHHHKVAYRPAPKPERTRKHARA